MTAAFSTGDHVRYGANGICLVADVTARPAPGRRGTVPYYILRPVAAPGMTLYVPTENETLTARLERIPTREELDGRILDSARDVLPWPDDRKERAALFRDIVKAADQTQLLRLVSCLFLKQRALLAAGRKLSATDEGILKQAELSIRNDFAFILGLPPEAVGDYIRRCLDTGAQS